jgi:hypothetical protein
LCRLAGGEACVSDLEDSLDIRQPTLSQQFGRAARGRIGQHAPGRQAYLLQHCQS